MVCWYNTMALCTRLVLVHYSIVVKRQIGRHCITECVYVVCWYNIIALSTRLVLVHDSIVVNPCRPIGAGCGALLFGGGGTSHKGQRMFRSPSPASSPKPWQLPEHQRSFSSLSFTQQSAESPIPGSEPRYTGGGGGGGIVELSNTRQERRQAVLADALTCAPREWQISVGRRCRLNTHSRLTPHVESARVSTP